ncbi:FecR domain-containing protein, partial [Pyxidicoccus sp. 3LFB2]
VQAVRGEDSAPDTARAESTSGAVVREVGGAERALQTGAKLRSGVAVRTPARSTAMLRLPDASRVRLSEGSDVELSRAEAREVHLTVRQGRLSVQASHAARQGFLVEAAGLRVSVVGTVFTVERTEHGAAVAVAEGQVRVDVEGQPTRLVGAGERVELDSRERTLKHEAVSAPDQQAFEALSAPAPAQDATAEAIAAVAHDDAGSVCPHGRRRGIGGGCPVRCGRPEDGGPGRAWGRCGRRGGSEDGSSGRAEAGGSPSAEVARGASPGGGSDAARGREATEGRGVRLAAGVLPCSREVGGFGASGTGGRHRAARDRLRPGVRPLPRAVGDGVAAAEVDPGASAAP